MINCGTLRVLPYVGLDVNMYVKCLDIEMTGWTLLFPLLVELYLILLVRKLLSCSLI